MLSFGIRSTSMERANFGSITGGPGNAQYTSQQGYLTVP
jgi:hypothetical protein